MQTSVINTVYVPVIPAFPNKDPSDNLNYGADFTDLLSIDNDSIASILSLTATPPGLTIEDQAIVGNIVAFRAEGGTAGVRYKIDFEIFTIGGNTYNRSVMMPVVNL